MLKPVLTLAAMIPLAISAQADFVTLKDGKNYEGTLIGASRTEITLEVERAKRRFTVDEVASIRFERAPAAGERSRSASPSSPIDQKYSVSLGSAAGDEQMAPDGRGRYRLYQNGAIYYTPQTGAHAMSGPIGDMWLSLGAERAVLSHQRSNHPARRPAYAAFRTWRHHLDATGRPVSRGQRTLVK